MLDRSTLADWVGRAAWHLQPVHERLLEHIRSSTKIFADETTAPVLAPGRGRTKSGQLWANARDDRPWGGADPPLAVYVYAQNRKSEQLLADLAGFTGVVQVDGYAGYRALAQRNNVSLAFCWLAQKTTTLWHFRTGSGGRPHGVIAGASRPVSLRRRPPGVDCGF